MIHKLYSTRPTFLCLRAAAGSLIAMPLSAAAAAAALQQWPRVCHSPSYLYNVHQGRLSRTYNPCLCVDGCHAQGVRYRTLLAKMKQSNEIM